MTKETSPMEKATNDYKKLFPELDEASFKWGYVRGCNDTFEEVSKDLKKQIVKQLREQGFTVKVKR